MKNTTVASEYRLTKKKLLAWLDRLAAEGTPAGCLYLPPGLGLDEVTRTLTPLLDLARAPRHLTETITASATGASVYWGNTGGYLILPPFPIAERHTGNYNAEPLCRLLLKQLDIAIVLIRLGDYAIGVFHDNKLVSSKVGAGNIHSRHRQGGSSSHRFERHRDKQIETFFTRVCGHVRENLEPHARELDWVVYGGTKETVLEFRKQCSFLRQFDGRTHELRLNVREPKQATLEASIEEIWSSRVVEWRWESP